MPEQRPIQAAQEPERIRKRKNSQPPLDYSQPDQSAMGVMPGDGIGSLITEQALGVFRALMATF